MDEVFCYVGDIAGYKNILLSLPPEEQQVRIREFGDLCKNATKKYGFHDSYIIVSDTIFVIAKKSKEDLRNLLEFSSYMLKNGIEKALPIRAAIDFGVAHIDKENSLVYGKAAAEAYVLAEEQDWIGTCCAVKWKDCCSEDKKEEVPELPFIGELWNFDLVFVYPVPMKNGKVLFRPVVSWEVPQYRKFRSVTVEGGLVVDKYMDWKYANRIQNTIIFSQYLNLIKCGRIKAKPEVFRGDLPIQLIDDVVEEALKDDIILSRGGASIIRIPGRDKLIILTSDKDKLISELKDHL